MGQFHIDGADASPLGMTAVLLVGGMGTRLRSVLPSTPKPLARVGDRSFLELLILQLRHQGIDNVVMCTGYLADQIEAHFGDGRHLGVTIAYSREVSPMGTAGALKLADSLLGSTSDFFVLNGDSLIQIDFCRFLQFHRKHGGIASLAARFVENAAEFGTLTIDRDSRVTKFIEKTGIMKPGLVNAGVYAFRSKLLGSIEPCPASLEHDVFPQILDHGVFALEHQGLFIDIGTPQDYARANASSHQIYNAALDHESTRI